MNSARTARWYGLPLALVLLGVLFGVLAAGLGSQGWTIAAPFAAFLAAAFVFQRQRLEEERLSQRLFQELNARYRELNEPLRLLRDSGRPPSEAERSLLADYVDLCAEQHVFATKGYVETRVWRSWCAGMLRFLEHPALRDTFAEELAGRTHYGLTLDAIRHAGHSS